MADIFISYARPDQPEIEALAAALEGAGYSVWWDRHIRGGAAYAKDIEKELDAAKAVIVAWSAVSSQSDWVKDEAALVREKGKLVPISLDATAQPLGFRQYQAIDFSAWRRDPESAAARSLLASLQERIEHAPDEATNETISPAAAAPFDKRMLAIAGSAPIVVAALFIWLLMKPGSEVAIAADDAAPVAIAVLPFADMSADNDQQYFSDGLSEELLNVLARVDGFNVASRTSAFALKDEKLSIGDIARRLGVDYVLEGSVRKSRSEIRVTAQLIEAASDRHLWSETYDRHLSDIFRIQDEIATAVVEAVRSELGVERAADIVIEPATADLSAYEKYLKARELFTARGKDNVVESLRLSEEITSIDPGFARGWEQLAAVYAIAPSWGIGDKDYSALAMDAAAKALEIDPALSMPHAVIGLVYRTHYPTPWAVSIGELKKAITNDPKNTSAWLWLGMDYMALAYHEQAIEAFTRCLDLDPAYQLCRKYRSIVYLFVGDEERAFEDASKNAEVGYFNDFDVYIPTLLKRGDRFGAFTVSRFINWRGGFPHQDYITALSEPESLDPEAFERLTAWAKEKKYDVLDATNVLLAYRAYDPITVDTFDNDYEDLWLPAFADFRKSAKFRELVTELGILDHWRSEGFPPQCHSDDDGGFVCG